MKINKELMVGLTHGSDADALLDNGNDRIPCRVQAYWSRRVMNGGVQHLVLRYVQA